MPQPLAVRVLLCCTGLLSCTTGCSCSSHIPESPPGDGPVGEIRNVQTGEAVPSVPSPAPAANPYANRPPLPGQPAPVKPSTTADTLP